MRLRSILLGAMVTCAFASQAQAQKVTASGWVGAGVEVGCLILESEGKLYNITGAVPSPKPGTYGTVTGTVFDGASTCMQGIILGPATWEERRPKK